MENFLELPILEKEMLRRLNKQEFALFYDELNWISEVDIDLLSTERQALLRELLELKCKPGYNNTKIDCTSLSEGCRLCAEGKWSCLFINNICNASCFYCPTEQIQTSIPSTNNLSFNNAGDYLDYLAHFGFKACSISGGEPLLTLYKTLQWIKAIKKKFGNSIYLWMYTNGISTDQNIIQQLADFGLDEIRFDIASIGYKTEKAELAVKFIPTVTVEIPSVPGDENKLEALVDRLNNEGIKHLNLHQLRGTLYNLGKLSKRNLSFIHGPKILVAKSENTALKTIKYAKSVKADLGVNYCSFVFKNAFQGHALRYRAINYVIRSYEDITDAGYIRSLFVKANNEQFVKQQRIFQDKNISEELYKYFPQLNKIYFSLQATGFIIDELETGVDYSSTTVYPNVTYSNYFTEISLNKSKKLSVEKYPVLHNCKLSSSGKMFISHLKEINNEKDYYNFFYKAEAISGITQKEKEDLIVIKNLEFLRWGLQYYF